MQKRIISIIIAVTFILCAVCSAGAASAPAGAAGATGESGAAAGTVAVDFHYTAGSFEKVLDVILTVEISNIIDASADFTLKYGDDGLEGNEFVYGETIVAQAPCTIVNKGVKQSKIGDRTNGIWLQPLNVTEDKFRELSKNKSKEGGYRIGDTDEFVSDLIWNYTGIKDRVELTDSVTLQKGYYILGYDGLGTSSFGYLEIIGEGEVAKPADEPATSTVPDAKPADPAADSESGKTVTTSPTASAVFVNGKQVVFDAYNIDDYNYFKLRDIAMALNGSEKEFEVGWDEISDAISLTSRTPYTPSGGEMAVGALGEQQAVPTTSKIFLDGKEIQLTAYKINDYNYFKLRDLGKCFDFLVAYDGENDAIVIDTALGYSE